MLRLKSKPQFISTIIVLTMIGLLLGLTPPVVLAAGPYAYITNQSDNTVSVIDTSTNTVIGSPLAVGSFPFAVAVNPAGTRVYVTNLVDNTVSVIDTSNNTVIGAPIAVGNLPQGIAVNMTGTRVYVANAGSGTISVIDTSTNTVIQTITVGGAPIAVVVNPVTTQAYVVNHQSSTIWVIDTSTNTIIQTIAVGWGPYGIAVNLTGTRVYVANQGDNSLSVIDTSTNTVIQTITVGVGSGLAGVAVNPAGTRVYVTNSPNGTVSIIDTNTNTIISSPIAIGIEALGVGVNPTGTRVYVAYSYNTVSVIDTSTNTVIQTITVGNAPAAFGQFIIPASTIGSAILASSSGSITNSVAMDETAATTACGGTPPPVGYTIPYGFFAYDITGLTNGETTNMVMTLPGTMPIGTTILKCNSSNQWVSIPNTSDNGDNVLTYSLKDGDSTDHDGIANGIIDDPICPCVPVPAVGGVAQTITVPTASTNGLGYLISMASVVMLVGAGWLLKRQR